MTASQPDTDARPAGGALAGQLGTSTPRKSTFHGRDPHTVAETCISRDTPTTCQARTRLYRDGRLVEQGFAVERAVFFCEEIGEELAHGGGVRHAFFVVVLAGVGADCEGQAREGDGGCGEGFQEGLSVHGAAFQRGSRRRLKWPSAKARRSRDREIPRVALSMRMLGLGCYEVFYCGSEGAAVGGVPCLSLKRAVQCDCAPGPQADAVRLSSLIR